jgi:hypothetical protein
VQAHGPWVFAIPGMVELENNGQIVTHYNHVHELASGVAGINEMRSVSEEARSRRWRSRTILVFEVAQNNWRGKQEQIKLDFK